MVAYSDYKRMVDEYSGLSDPGELKSLEAYWVKEFGVVSPNLKEPFDEALLQKGKELHQSSCESCHARPQWAFAGYGAAKIISPIGLGIDRARLPSVLWYIHILACFVGLAYLPFSKMFHIFASSVSLLANGVIGKEKLAPANRATLQAMELDACTHCGTCSLRCSVIMAFEEIANRNIFPSEKIASIKALASGKELSPQELRHIQEGVYLCSNCYRCTVVCPGRDQPAGFVVQRQRNSSSKGIPGIPRSLSPLFLPWFNEGRNGSERLREALDPGERGHCSSM